LFLSIHKVKILLIEHQIDIRNAAEQNWSGNVWTSIWCLHEFDACISPKQSDPHNQWLVVLFD
jgi:hypothetical protein